MAKKKKKKKKIKMKTTYFLFRDGLKFYVEKITDPDINSAYTGYGNLQGRYSSAKDAYGEAIYETVTRINLLQRFVTEYKNLSKKKSRTK